MPQCAQVVFELWADVGQQVSQTVAHRSRRSRTRIKHFEGRPETQNTASFENVFNHFLTLCQHILRKKKIYHSVNLICHKQSVTPKMLLLGESLTTL